MSELMTLDRDLIPLLAILCSAVVAIVWVIAAYYRSVQVADMDTTLKLEMIQRGMSADDIERVLQVHSDSACTRQKVASFKIDTGKVPSDKHAQPA